MSQIVNANKSERVTSVELKSYYGTLTISEDRYTRGYNIVAQATDPRLAMLDEMLSFAQPSENECPPREITLQSVIDQLQSLRDGMVKYDKEPKTSISFTLDVADADVITAVLKGGELSYENTSTIRKAIAPANSDW